MFSPIHKHLLVKAIVNRPLVKEEVGRIFLKGLVDLIGMVPVTAPQAIYVNEPGNEGLTGSINLATSHIAFHVWDTTKLLMLDVYSCKEFNTKDVVDYIDINFDGIKQGHFMTIDRENLGQQPVLEYYIGK